MGDGRHRNNAAEWLLWFVLLPAAPVAWLIEFFSASFASRR